MHPTHLPVYPVVGTPADILRAAAHYITAHGWTRGEYYFHEADTDPSTWPHADGQGAIGIAVHGHVTVTPHNADLPNFAAYERACDALRDYLEVADDFLHDVPDAEIGEWNDQPDMTAERVIAALNNAAERWDNLSGGAA